MNTAMTENMDWYTALAHTSAQPQSLSDSSLRSVYFLKRWKDFKAKADQVETGVASDDLLSEFEMLSALNNKCAFSYTPLV